MKLEYDDETTAWVVGELHSMFGDDICCSVCEESDTGTLLGVLDYARTLRSAGQFDARVCHGCGHVIANLYTFRHGGSAEFDVRGDWPKLPPVAGGKRTTISHRKAMQTFERDGYACKSCGSQENLEPDHILPVSRGGNNDLANLQTLCSACNNAKGNKINWTGRQGLVL